MAVGSMFASFTLVTFLWHVRCIAALIAARPSEKTKANARVPAGMSAWRLAGAGAAVVFVAVAVLLGMQDASYAELQDASNAKDFPAAVGAYDRAVRYSFGMPGYELWSSRQMATLGVVLTNKPGGPEAWKKSAEAASLAETQGEERFSAIYQSAILAIAANDLPRATAKAREAIDIAPNWYKPHLLLAQILQASGKNDEAGREARVAAELGWKAR